MSTKGPRTLLALAAAMMLCVGALLGGCGGDDDSGGAGQGGASESAVPPDVAEYVEKMYTGNFGEPPTSGPKPEPGKTVWIISCSQAINSCADPSNQAAEAARLIGWKAKVFDGKFTPETMSAGVRQAIAAKADGVILAAVDCANTKGALQQAKKAGVKIVTFYSHDCDDPYVKGEPLFDASNVIQGTQTYSEVVKGWARTRAAYTIVKTEGKGKVIHYEWPQLIVLRHVKDGFEAEMKKCSGCEIVETVPFTGADLGPKLAQKTQSAILQHPQANAVVALNDGSVVAGIDQGIRASGRTDKLLKVGGEAFPANIKLLREGGQDALIAFPAAWNGWAAVDTMNRVLQGEEPVETGIGWQIVDREHNLPEGDEYKPPVDYESAYKKAWGVSE